MSELTSRVERLRSALSGPAPDGERFEGARADARLLEPLELGALLPLVHRIIADEEAPEHTRGLAREVTWAQAPVAFTADTCAELFAVLAERPRPTDVRMATAALVRCVEPWHATALADAAAVLVQAALDNGDRPIPAFETLAVAALAGPEAEREVVGRLRHTLRESPLALAELEVLAESGAYERALMAEDAGLGFHTQWPALPDPLARVPADSRYAEAARRILCAAAEHLTAIHRGDVPYVSDKAFGNGDCDALRRAAGVALQRDEPWAGDLLAAILPKVAVAPTSAKTLPSQSACIGLAQAVEAWPTPESVAALREARRVVRHAGITKKLDRLVRRAERNLAVRPAVVTRLPDLGIGPTGERRLPVGPYVAVVSAAGEEPSLSWERPDTGAALRALPAAARRDRPDEVAAARELLKKVRAQQRTLAVALEGGFALNTTYRYGRWRDDLAAHPVAGPVCRRLIWEFESAPGEWHGLLPVEDPPLPDLPPGTPVRLWHPARAGDAERAEWRARVMALALRQPFRQAYREQYAPPETGLETAMFQGPLVRMEAVLGVAVREGWNIEYDVLVRRFGTVMATIDFGWGHIYPGMTGWCGALQVRLDRPLGELDPVLRSEILRTVDLLAAVGSFGWWDDEENTPQRWEEIRRLHDMPLGTQSRLRRDALRRVLAASPTGAQVEVADRHVTVRGHTVHLATGRVSRDGDPVDIAVPTGKNTPALPYLPYDDRLLERMVRTVEALLEAG
ncbi:DUF4132 domain-containing protein [Streptomyces sp. NBC_01361]|uniref:DUF4132 domain-containing protein n=1 Tax=Streptomyces sp. NBC_01361 TaxID=2903838 RepID=UPI002E2EFA05|nr:DUF4132 domain-containing protein [Streptomyces sp. NBC_01361]